VRLVVHETPPKPTFQSTGVPQLAKEELFVMLITVVVRGDVDVLEFK
jgi:hypothetical protein